ncbi:prepilin-type N-terminal cleavage/methylation domain-containing protein [Deinococcus sp. Arct2-2]|uniref:prepilin-type N-terminal cleavage/methylation domain-containing protein n=1 Tax=Deinococcus sp. Arct2-2 TaxID=2568653 RepID=UPI0010A34737|nr:prepilin-type N-terminal cleavage/methylation domain-containing protein [Deinococcus sp. Arct2-2]THF71651.1 prepilin-type N-terminal cleavage/methylation domain-containing protein [Deinococcus sp. Arct2-2]
MRTQAFTLLEVLVGLAIIGIIAGIGIVSLIGSIRSSQADQAVTALVGVFAEAKNRVRNTNKNVKLAWNSTTKTITLSQSGAVVNTTKLSVDTMTSVCRSVCVGNEIELLAPHGALPQDVKFSLAVVNRGRTAYLLGPTAMLKVTSP